MAQRDRTRLASYLLPVLPPLFWAGNFVVARIMRDEIPPVQMSLWRWAAAALIILPLAVAHLRHDGPRIRRNLPFLAILALVGVTAFNCFIYVALHYTTVLNGALINSLLPLATFILAYLLLGDRLLPRQVLGIAVSLAGAVVVITRGDPMQLLQVAPNVGDFLVLAGLSAWALYTTLVKWRPPGLHPISLIAVTFAFGALFHIPFAAVEFWMIGGFEPTFRTIAAISYLAVFPSLLAYLIWNKSVAVLGPGRTGMYMHLMPIFSALLAAAFLGEAIGSYHVAAFALVFVGIGLVTRPAPAPGATDPTAPV